MGEPGAIEQDPRAPVEPAAWQDGTDPAGWADTAGATDPFPPPLQLDVRPAGGRWIDPGLLGQAPADADPPADPPEQLRADLAAADGDPDAGWTTLHDSDDPAVRALAVRWRP